MDEELKAKLEAIDKKRRINKQKTVLDGTSKYAGRTIRKKELLAAVAKSTKVYTVPEVEDILIHMTSVMQQALASGKIVHIPGLGRIQAHPVKRKVYRFACREVQVKRKNPYRVKFTADNELKDYLMVNCTIPRLNGEDTNE